MQERMAAARQEAETLKDRLRQRMDELADTELKDAAGNVPLITKSDKMKVRKQLKGHLAKIYALHWATKNNQLVSASQDGNLLIWDALTEQKLNNVPLRTSWVMTCAFSPDSNFVACGGLDNICSVYNLATRENPGQPARELTSHIGYLSCCRFLDHRRILTSSGDMTCILWDVEASSKITEFVDHDGDVMSLSVNPTDENQFVSGACDTTARVWDIRTGACTHSFMGHDNDINAVQFFPSGMAFGSGGDDASCRLFDLRSYHALQTYRHASILCGITSVAFSRSGRFLFAGYDDFHCNVWDVLHGERVATLQGHDNRVSCLGVPDDGLALCTGSWDHQLKCWA